MADDDRAPLSQWAWFDLVRRARLPHDLKAAALAFGSYANADGTSVFCGVPRLALDLDCSYSTAQRLLRRLRELELIELVRQVRKRRMSDEYRLIHGQALLDKVEVPDPDRYRDLVDELRKQNRVKSKRSYDKSQLSDLTQGRRQKATGVAGASDVTLVEVRKPILTSDPADSDLKPNAVTSGDVTTTNHVLTSPQELPPIKTADVSTAVTGTRAREPVENPDFSDEKTNASGTEPASPAGEARWRADLDARALTPEQQAARVRRGAEQARAALRSDRGRTA